MAEGSDKLGDFIVDNYAGTCGVCGKEALRVHYSAFEARGHDDLGPIDPKRLLAWRGGMIAALGIECGCYSRLHRQVAHIQTEQKYRAR